MKNIMLFLIRILKNIRVTVRITIKSHKLNGKEKPDSLLLKFDQISTLFSKVRIECFSESRCINHSVRPNVEKYFSFHFRSALFSFLRL